MRWVSIGSVGPGSSVANNERVTTGGEEVMEGSEYLKMIGWGDGYSWGHKKALLDLIEEFQSYEQYPEWWEHGQEMECVLIWLREKL